MLSKMNAAAAKLKAGGNLAKISAAAKISEMAAMPKPMAICGHGGGGIEAKISENKYQRQAKTIGSSQHHGGMAAWRWRNRKSQAMRHIAAMRHQKAAK